MNTKISKDWFMYVLSRFVAYEMDDEERQKFIETLLQSWMRTRKDWDMYELGNYFNSHFYGKPIEKIEQDSFWEKELNTIK